MNYHISNSGWQNTAALCYPIQPHPQQHPQAHVQAQPYPNTMTPGYPSLPTPFGMPPLPNSPLNNRVNGVSLSYGFAPNIIPCHIPNERKQDSHPKGPAIGPANGPAIGWSIGDKTDGACISSHSAEDKPIENKQVEVLCRAIIVPDEDLPIYSFGFPTVSCSVKCL